MGKYLVKLQSLDFMGVKNLRHISVSQHQNRRIKILLWKNSALHFFEAELKDKERPFHLRKKLIESEAVIKVSLQNKDDVLHISKDHSPAQKKGVYFIQTVNRQFFALIASQKKQELYNLSQKSRIFKLYSSVLGIWSSSINEEIQQKLVFSNILIKQLNDTESFKAITLRDYELQVRFVNTPINPGDKCKFETYQLHSLNLKGSVFENFAQDSSNFILIRSQIYQMNENEVIIIFLLKNSVQRAFFEVVSVLVDYKKNEIKQVNQHTLKNQNLFSVDFIKFHENGELKHIILTQKFEKQTIISKINVSDLKTTDQKKIEFEGDSLLCSKDQLHLLFLTPYKVFHINWKGKDMISESESSATLEEESEKTFQKGNQLAEIISFVSISKNKISHDFQESSFDKVLNYLSTIGMHLDIRIKAFQQKLEFEEDLKSIMKIWTSCSLYDSIVQFEKQSQKKLSIENRTFNDLQDKNFKQISNLFTHIISNEKTEEIFTIWTKFLESYRTKDFFKDQKIRQAESEILGKSFFQIINKALASDLINNQNHETIVKFIKVASGIIKIQNEVYRELFKCQNGSYAQTLKSIAFETLNLDLIHLLFFETSNVSRKEIKEAFDFIKVQQSSDNYTSFVSVFVKEYLARMSQNKVANNNVKDLSDLLCIFPDKIDLLGQVFEKSDTDLSILFGLREGKRKQIAPKILQVAGRMKKTDNAQVMNF